MNERLIRLSAQLDEAIEFGSGGVQSAVDELMEFGSMSMKRLRRARRITGDSPRQRYKRLARRKRLGPPQYKKGYDGRHVDVSDIKRRTAQKAGGEHPMTGVQRREKQEALARTHAKRIGATGGGSGAKYPNPRKAAEDLMAISKEHDLIERRMRGRKSFRGHRQ
mgnify:CR=1 FL=1